MSNQSRGKKVQDDLTLAVGAGILPADAQLRAEKLLDRLQQPVRLGLMGVPGAGKSTLLNLLVGADVIPQGVRLPTLQLSFGPTAQSVCTLPDGTKKTLSHTDAAQIAELAPVFVEMQMPLPALGKISVLEVVAPADPTALQRASDWAAKRCDIALWCTQGFGEVEQTIWGRMPDLIKDHAFLMVTKADALRENGLMDATIGAVRNAARDEFNQILPIATTDALAARQPDGTVDRDRMRSSGGLALISAVLKQVEQGRQSFVDMAEVLLLQHQDALQAATSVEIPESHDLSVETHEPAVPDVATSAPTPATESTPVEQPAPAGSPEKTVTLHPATRAAYEHVLDYIIAQSRALIDLAEKVGDAAPAQIMAKTVEHVQWLSDYLNEHGDDTDPALIRARDTAMDAADLVQLMQMEKRDSAAVEALSLMIQIKHELQADLAA
ncbi:hypothetical protein [Yoonia sp.]|uniref:hypothetical protein n=1 Tax=Yoonia sp. TaxID=2212373 RepID=UPI003F6C4245